MAPDPDPDGREADLDSVYFEPISWDERLRQWISGAADDFIAGNRHVIDQAADSPESGLRVVVNIGAHALVSFVDSGRYLNLYERPVIGGPKPKEVSDPRQQVDADLRIGSDTYFGAVALGGVGVRYYGEYCMVLDLTKVQANPQLFDRDSYDILEPPLHGHSRYAELITTLTGRWETDRHAMVLLKVLPELVHQSRLVTTGTISEAVLKDQEFIEVHMKPPRAPGVDGGFGPDEVIEIRQSPDEVSVALRLREQEADAHRLDDVEHEWLVRRECAERAIRRAGRPTRVVTQHGRGYQWA